MIEFGSMRYSPSLVMSVSSTSVSQAVIIREPTGKEPFARVSSSVTGIRRSVDLGGTGRAGGTVTSS